MNKFETYYDSRGVPGLDRLANTYPEHYRVPESFTVEQVRAVILYTVATIIARTHEIDSPEELVALATHSRAGLEVGRAFGNDIEAAIGAVKLGLEVAREVFDSIEARKSS